MLIGKYKYKGFDYEIHFTGQGDWGKHKNHFYSESANGFKTEFHKDFDSCTEEFKNKVDEFLVSAPKTVSELIEKLGSECMVWKGYEDCELDEQKAKILIEAFMASYEGKSK